MKTLLSKVQYKDFEPGEFVDDKERSFDELITLVNAFPWEAQREKLVVDLTNPSITIEGDDDDYLKLAVYFNGKFVLHYFDKNLVLYNKSFTSLSDSFVDLAEFYSGRLDLSTFTKQNGRAQRNLWHFASQDFEYIVDGFVARKYLLRTSGSSFALSLFILCFFYYRVSNEGWSGAKLALVLVFLFAIMFLIGGGLNLVLFVNYYRNSKDKKLVMSRGNDMFCFGNAVSPASYHKNDIASYTVVRVRRGRSGINHFSVAKLLLKSGEELILPNLLIDENLLRQKLYMIEPKEEHRFPTI